MMGLTQNFITPFALALKATTVQIGLLSSFPNFTMSFSQLTAPFLVDKAGSRKKTILPFVFIHAVMWTPLFLLPYFFQDSGVWLLIGLFTLLSVAGAITNPPWGSMMADMVHEEIRGRYFGFRGRIVTLTALVSSLAAGFLLQHFTGNIFLGFAIIFGGATICRLFSVLFISRMHEPPLVKQESGNSSLFHIIAGLGKSNVGRFTIFMSMVYCSIMMAGPFFSVYMLEDLKIDYVTYTFINCASSVSSIIFLPFWGKRADRAGNLKIIKTTASLLPTLPLLWLVSGNPYYLIGVNVFSGFVWSGFDLSSINFLYDASPPETRTRQIAVFNSITSIAISIGALTGGYLAPHLPETFGYSLRTLFTLSGVLRAAIAFFMLRTLFEVRNVTKVDMFHLLTGRKIRKYGIRDRI